MSSNDTRWPVYKWGIVTYLTCTSLTGSKRWNSSDSTHGPLLAFKLIPIKLWFYGNAMAGAGVWAALWNKSRLSYEFQVSARKGFSGLLRRRWALTEVRRSRDMFLISSTRISTFWVCFANFLLESIKLLLGGFAVNLLATDGNGVIAKAWLARQATRQF